MTFAAIAAATAFSSLGAQQVPGRDLFRFPVGTLAEASALAVSAGGGFWNPATIALGPMDRFRFSASALDSPIEQGVTAQLGTAAFRIPRGLTLGLSFAQAGVGDIPRTDSDPQSLGDGISYTSTIISGVAAATRGAATAGIAVRRRTGDVDLASGRATSIDVGAVIDRPAGLPVRGAIASFLLSPSRALERATGVAALEGYLPWAEHDLRAGVSYQHDEGGGNERFVFASAKAGLLDLRGGIAQESLYGSTSTRLRLGIGVRYAHYLVGIARDDGTSGLGATYQFVLT
ncbi:MAG: hypothetical protein ABIY52_04690, partial [Gemmatimonadaceae bacterium]